MFRRRSFSFFILLLFATTLLLYFVQKQKRSHRAPNPNHSEISEAPRHLPAAQAPATAAKVLPLLEPAPEPRATLPRLPNPIPSAKASSPLLARQGGTLGTQIPTLPRGTATIELEAGSRSPRNFEGHYQRVLIGSKAPAEIALHWPSAGPREVVVHPIHGGTVNGKSGAQILQTDARGHLKFRFKTAENAGRYEILLRSGPSEEVLHFWVPTDHPEVDLHGL